MSEKDMPVECAQHGSGPGTFMCTHLAYGVACGFNDSGTPDDPWPDAWCDACEVVRAREGEWNDVSEAQSKITMQCTACYEEARRVNRNLPPPLKQGMGVLTEEQKEEFFHTATHFTQTCQAKAEQRYGLSGFSKWHFDADRDELWFYTPGQPQALVAKAELVGSLSNNTNTWLWAWGNSHIEGAKTSRLLKVRTFGEAREIKHVAEPHWAAEEVDGWEMTSVAFYLMGGEAVYRAPMDHLFWFMMLHSFRTAPTPKVPLGSSGS